jgi:hypothetical protein
MADAGTCELGSTQDPFKTESWTDAWQRMSEKFPIFTVIIYMI